MVVTIVQSGIVEVGIGFLIALLGIARQFGANVPHIEFRITTRGDREDCWSDHSRNFPQPHSSLPYPFDLIWRAAAWPLACYFVVLGHYSFAHNRAFFANLMVFLFLLFVVAAFTAFICCEALQRPDAASIALFGHALAISLFTADIVMNGSLRMFLIVALAPLAFAAAAFFVRK